MTLLEKLIHELAIREYDQQIPNLLAKETGSHLSCFITKLQKTKTKKKTQKKKKKSMDTQNII